MRVLNIMRRRERGFSKSEIARFCGQLKMLLASGVPLLEGLKIINDLFPRRAYNEVVQRIVEGDSLAAALRPAFPPLVVSTVAGAERAGNLEAALAYLRRYYEDRCEVEEKFKSALVYPVFVLSLCLLSFVVMIFFVLPGFKDLFVDMETNLPLLTRIIISSADIFLKFWYLPGLLVGGAVGLLLYFRQKEQGRQQFDSWLLNIKWFGCGQVAQAFRVFGSLLQGGIPLVAALNTLLESIDNRAFYKIVLELKGSLEDGEKLSGAMSKHKVFPAEAVQMVSVGENSGKLDDMLLGIAGFYEAERELFLRRVTSLLEPALTLFVGLAVGVIALGMFLPMVSMISGLE